MFRNPSLKFHTAIAGMSTTFLQLAIDLGASVHKAELTQFLPDLNSMLFVAMYILDIDVFIYRLPIEVEVCQLVI